MPSHSIAAPAGPIIGTAMPLSQITPARFGMLVSSVVAQSTLLGKMLAARLTADQSDKEMAPYVAIVLASSKMTGNTDLLHKVVARMITLRRHNLLLATAYLVGRDTGKAVLDQIWEPNEKAAVLHVFAQVSRTMLRQVSAGSANTGPRLAFSLGSWIAERWDDVEDAIAAVVDVAQAAVDAATQFANDVLDKALDLASALQSLVDESIDVLAAFADTLIDAGKTVGDVLSAALEVSGEMLEKMVQAIAAVKERALDAIDWVVAHTGSIGTVVSALLKAAVLPLAIVERALIAGVAILEVSRTLIAAAGSLVNYMEQLVHAAADTLKATLRSVFELGYNVASIVGELASAAMSHLIRGQFLAALAELGHAALDLLKAAWTFGATQLAIIFAGFVSLWSGRRLTPAELADVVRVYGFWPKLLDVWIVQGSIPADIVGLMEDERPFTTMSTLVFPSPPKQGELVHELMHVHQFLSQGALYMVDSMEQQARQGDGAYKYKLGAHPNLGDYHVEQQAQLVQDYYLLRYVEQSRDFRAYLPYVKPLCVAPPQIGTSQFEKWVQRCPQALEAVGLIKPPSDPHGGLGRGRGRGTGRYQIP